MIGKDKTDYEIKIINRCGEYQYPIKLSLDEEEILSTIIHEEVEPFLFHYKQYKLALDELEKDMIELRKSDQYTDSQYGLYMLNRIKRIKNEKGIK